MILTNRRDWSGWLVAPYSEVLAGLYLNELAEHANVVSLHSVIFLRLLENPGFFFLVSHLVPGRSGVDDRYPRDRALYFTKGLLVSLIGLILADCLLYRNVMLLKATVSHLIVK